MASAASSPAAGMSDADSGASLGFAEANSDLQIFKDRRSEDHTASIRECFPPQDFMSEERVLKALHRLRALHMEPVGLNPCRVFRIREKALLFASLAGASVQDLEDAEAVADYFALPKQLSVKVSQQLACHALIESSGGGTSAPTPFFDQLSSVAALQPLVQAGLAYVKEITDGLPKRCGYNDIYWRFWADPAKKLLTEGLTGEPLKDDGSAFEVAVYSVGCIFAEKEPPYHRLPRGHGASSLKSYRHYLSAVSFVAAALGRQDVLTVLHSDLEWRDLPAFVVFPAAWKCRQNLIAPLWGFTPAAEFTPFAQSLAEGVVKGGSSALPLLRYFVEEMKVDTKYFSMKALSRHLIIADDSLPIIDYLASVEVRMPPEEEVTAFARLGAMDRVQAYHEKFGSFPKGILEAALFGRHPDIALWALEKGAKWTDSFGTFPHNALSCICIGSNGDVGALDLWKSRGCPLKSWELSSLCETAARMDLPDVFKWISELPSDVFPGWVGTSLYSRKLFGAIQGDNLAVVEWAIDVSRQSVISLLGGADIPRAATLKGNLEVIKVLAEKGNAAVKGSLFEVAAQGPSHRPVLDYIMSASNRFVTLDWDAAARDYSQPGMAEGLATLVEDYGLVIAREFVQHAAYLGRLEALEFAWQKGARYPRVCVDAGFRSGNLELLAWIRSKDSGAVASMNLWELTIMNGDNKSTMAKILQWLWQEAMSKKS
jgi:hypothetical protein